MFRILFILVLLAVGFMLLKSWQRKKAIHTKKPPRTQRITEQIKRCEYCALHVPESDAVEQGGHFFCCQEHAILSKSD